MQAVKIGSLVDEDGEDISNTDKVLKSYGIYLRNAQGTFRDTGDVLDELGKKLIKEKTKKIDIKKYRIVVSPLEKGYNYSEEDQYKPHTWKRKVEFWKRVDDNAYSLLFVFSWYHFKYRIKRTKEQIVNKFSKKC